MTNFDPNTTSRRIYDLEGGNKLHCERKNPYGFISIHQDKGAVPPQLSGDYTSYDEADKAIRVYLNEKQKAVLEVINAENKEN